MFLTARSPQNHQQVRTQCRWRIDLPEVKYYKLIEAKFNGYVLEDWLEERRRIRRELGDLLELQLRVRSTLGSHDLQEPGRGTS